jgi:hypothetical protein
VNRSVARVIAGLGVMLAAVAFAPVASASISPSMALSQSTTAAGASADIGIDVSFSPSSGDSPKDLTVVLPAGLLANAAIDGGACLSNTSTTPVAACQVGTGTVTAAGLGILPITGTLAFDLVAPPKPGDLAGVAAFLTLLGNTSELGSPADVTVRPPGSADGVGLDMAFTDVPNTYDGLPISVDQLDTSFNGMRMPDSCPSTPASVTVSGDSYGDPTVRTATAPLTVTNCSALPYAPKFSVSATKDSSDGGVAVVTDITAQADEATSRNVALTLPPSVLTPNVEAVLSGGLLCSSATLSSCKPVGSASATSPLYPKTLTGTAYLTGTFTSPAITIAFPAPFALTLNGAVDLATNTTTFKQLPDIPLTDLKVALAGGPDAVFATTCNAPGGTASSTLTDQNGDRTVTVPAAFQIANYDAATCAPPPGQGSTPGSPSVKPGRPKLEAALSGLARGKPTLGFLLTAGTHAPKLAAFAVALPAGLTFVRHSVHHRLRLEGVTISGANARSVVLKRGVLVVTLRQAAAGVTVKVTSKGIKESAALKRDVRRRRTKSVLLTVAVRDAKGEITDLTARITHLTR